MFGVRQLIKFVSDTKIEKIELKRDLAHIRRTIEGLSSAIARLHEKLDRDDDRAADFNQRLSILEVFQKHENSGFQRVILGADKNASQN